MLHQKVRSVKVGDLSDADKTKYGLVGVPDSEVVAITISEQPPSLVEQTEPTSTEPAAEPTQ